MNDAELIQRQQALLVRSVQLRLSLAQQTEVLKRPLALADAAQSGLHKPRDHHPISAGLALSDRVEQSHDGDR